MDQTQPKFNKCIDCKYFAIQHPLAQAMMSPAVDDSTRAAWIKANVLNFGVCTRVPTINPVTGEQEYPFAINERRFGKCGPEGKFFESVNETNTGDTNHVVQTNKQAD